MIDLVLEVVLIGLGVALIVLSIVALVDTIKQGRAR